MKNTMKKEQKVVKKEQSSAASKNRKVKLTRKQRLQEKRKQKLEKLRQIKGQLTEQLAVVQNSTKSMGKFDRKAHQAQTTHKVKRFKVHSNFTNLQGQIDRNLQILNSVKRMQGSKKLNHSL